MTLTHGHSVSCSTYHLERAKNKSYTEWVGLRRVSKVGHSPLKAAWRDASLTRRNLAKAIKSDHTKMTATKKLASNMDGRIQMMEVTYPVGYYEISDSRSSTGIQDLIPPCPVLKE